MDALKPELPADLPEGTAATSEIPAATRDIVLMENPLMKLQRREDGYWLAFQCRNGSGTMVQLKEIFRKDSNLIAHIMDAWIKELDEKP